MSGAKRRTGYRKNVTAGVLDDLPEPEAGQLVAVVTGSRGGNMFEVQAEDGDVALCLLPTRYRKVVWVKRGQYVIVSGAEEDVEVSGGGKGKVKYRVEHILYKDQIKHLRSVGRWPEHFHAAAGKRDGSGAYAGADSDGDGDGDREGAIAGGALVSMDTVLGSGAPTGAAAGAGAGSGASAAAHSGGVEETKAGDAVVGAAAGADDGDADDGTSSVDSMPGTFHNPNRRRYGEAPPTSSDESSDGDSDEEPLY